MYSFRNCIIPCKFINRRIYRNILSYNSSFDIQDAGLTTSHKNIIVNSIGRYYTESESGSIQTFKDNDTSYKPSIKRHNIALVFNINRGWQRDIIEAHVLKSM